MKKVFLIMTALFVLSFNSVFALTIVCLNFGGGSWHCNAVKGSCGDAGGSGFSDFGGYTNGRYCVGVRAFSGNTNTPIIKTLSNGSAFIDNNGQITQIGSDKFERFIVNINKKTKKDFETFLKEDDGIVSKIRLEQIAAELGAKIEKSDKPINANYCPPCKENIKEIKKLSGNTKALKGK
jgi:hypothetical protein